jgi:hypothetical protein
MLLKANMHPNTSPKISIERSTCNNGRHSGKIGQPQSLVENNMTIIQQRILALFVLASLFFILLVVPQMMKPPHFVPMRELSEPAELTTLTLLSATDAKLLNTIREARILNCEKYFVTKVPYSVVGPALAAMNASVPCRSYYTQEDLMYLRVLNDIQRNKPGYPKRKRLDEHNKILQHQQQALKL